MLHRKTRFLAAVAVAATGLLSALASPAQDLFDEASYRLLFNYSGFSTVDLKGLVAKYQVALDKACAGKGESCGFDVAHKIIPDMLEELGDDHSGFYPPARNEDRQRQRQGLGSEALRVGINHQAIDGSSDRLVVRVRQDGPAAKAGLIRGDRITGLNGKPASEYREGFTEAMTAAIGTGKPIILNIV
ncbi:MAG TPA: PDZ domain-containing protein, partial [Deinococcales bacterium]|nr:PDZ domain-containing protein [Deinococcales bacterium]